MKAMIAFVCEKLHTAYEQLLQFPCQMSGIILKTYSVENNPSPRYTRTIRIKLRCLLNTAGPREIVFGGADAKMLIVCGEGFVLT